MFGRNGDYDMIKRHFNSLMMKYENEIYGKISASETPLHLASAYSMLGNYIDFGAMDSVDEEKLSEMLSDTDKAGFDEEEFKKLVCDLEKAKRLVFLTDNCGEIVTDKIFIKAKKECNGGTKYEKVSSHGNR